MSITLVLAKCLEFLKAHWPKVLAVGLIAVAFFAGRYTVPVKETVKVEEKIVYQDREVIKEVVVEKKVISKGETRVVVRDRFVYPDGSIHEHEEEKTDTKTDTKTDKDARVEVVKEVRVVEERVVEKIIDRRPQWRASLLVGADFNPAWQPIPGAGSLTLGAHLEFRPIGPVWVGVWGLHTGAVGGSIGVEF